MNGVALIATEDYAGSSEGDAPQFLQRDPGNRIRKILAALILAEDLNGFMALCPVAGVSTSSQVIVRMRVRLSIQQVADPRLKKRVATAPV